MNTERKKYWLARIQQADAFVDATGFSIENEGSDPNVWIILILSILIEMLSTEEPNK